MNKLFRLFFTLALLFFLNSCSNLFELNSDVLARQALFDLMKIQEKFYQENKRFTGKLAEINKYFPIIFSVSDSLFFFLSDLGDVMVNYEIKG